ncbi:CDP-glucose 4,6-dehydratase [Scatolibacter rhodanostii]|uniref:CDP-glucose 4,6-dehydratase n=1 Tax=Scatolibacter rhodanostii TaxID=2014781 RepID=UPI00190EB055|nr:CDP-glucose 4,6-dehydratase [Scatolibacter rhodanostii]
MENLEQVDFYRNKRVFVTGHTGFKGSWLCQILLELGAEVYGYALDPEKNSLYQLSRLGDSVRSTIADIRDISSLQDAFHQARPDVVFHLAAQPLVQQGFLDPVLTYDTNVMGTVHLLDCVRHNDSVGSVVNITTDKVYRNEEWVWGYRETDALGGHDPYSSSKSCSELVTQCYQDSFFSQSHTGISSMRAGNVIGGGDFAANRIIPDCIRAALEKQPVFLRNPSATRPYQHVLEPLFAYLLVAEQQYCNPKMSGSYNVGPAKEDCINNLELVRLFCESWGEDMSWKISSNAEFFPEANLLQLDCSKMAGTFDWKPHWNVKQAVEKTVEWTKGYHNGEDVRQLMKKQMDEYRAGGNVSV